ncbi:hypothetical protein Ddc_23747 [Ditylenchus destructor]|nr:hypothetical protein Ddc_23747 [Ditylenchus destructor]
MDIESREKLMPQTSEQIAIKRNIWNQLGLDIQLDVFQCLRAYDLYRNGRFVSRQWYNVIERHKGMLPKFRKLRDCSETNRIIERNEEYRQPDTLFCTILATLYLPEEAYLINWSINTTSDCNFFKYKFNYKYMRIVKKIRPELREALEEENKLERVGDLMKVKNGQWVSHWLLGTLTHTH